jgi:hypothetical protein
LGQTLLVIVGATGMVGGYALKDPADERNLTYLHIPKLGDPLLLARTQMLAAGIRLLYDVWRKEDAQVCVSGTLAMSTDFAK